MEICMKHSKAIPEPPSVRLGKPVAAELEGLLMRCLAKAPSERPFDAAALLLDLESCSVAGQWTAGDAAAWWAAHEQIGAGENRITNAPSKENQETPASDATMAYPGDRGANR